MYTVLALIDSNIQRAEHAAGTVAELPGSTAEIDVVLLNVFEELEVTGEGRTLRSDEVYDRANYPESDRVADSVLEDAGTNIIKR